MDGMFSACLTKENGKLVYKMNIDKSKYQNFIDEMKEGDVVEIFMAKSTPNGTLTQIAKVHKCIRMLAQETGTGFEHMKLLIKKRSGLIIESESEMDVKSFKDCSKEDLNIAINTCIELGDEFGINLR